MNYPTFVLVGNNGYCNERLSDVARRSREIGGAHERFANRIDEDAREFPLAVEQDLAAIQRGLMGDQDEPFARGSLLVFTNELAQQGKAKFGRRGQKELLDIDFKLPAPRHNCEREYPLARAEALEAALALTRQQCPDSPTTLVVKSHGGKEQALTTLAGELLDVPAEELQAVVEKLDLKDFADGNYQKLGRVYLGRVHLGRAHLGDVHLGRYHLGEVHLRGAYSAGYGATKLAVAAALSKASREMPIELVCLEACDATLGGPSLKVLPRDLTTYALKTATSYRNVNYAQAFKTMRDGQSLAAAMSDMLAKDDQFEKQVGLGS